MYITKTIKCKNLEIQINIYIKMIAANLIQYSISIIYIKISSDFETI